MNYFFRKKLQHTLRKEHLPLRADFYSQLHSELFTMKSHSRSMRGIFARIGVALCTTTAVVTAAVFVSSRIVPTVTHQPATPIAYAYTITTTNTSTYREHTFIHNPEDADSSQHALAEIMQKEKVLFAGAQSLEMHDAGYYTYGTPVEGFNALVHYAFNGHTYTLKTTNIDAADGSNPIVVLSEGSTTLFTHEICFPAALADGEPQMLSVNGNIALHFYECEGAVKEGDNHNATPYTSNIYFEGKNYNDTYAVKNTRFVFEWNGKTGFVADDSSGRSFVYYDSQKVSDGFDSIFTQNCCATRELTPTLYDNGTLVMFGTRDNKDIITEIKLPE